MTENQFRRIALALDDVVERSHMGHPDFRANGRIFATLHHDRQSGMVALTPDQQRRLMSVSPAFTPENGAWGRSGYTRVRLADIDEELLGEALTLAWQNSAAKAAPRRTRAGSSERPPVQNAKPGNAKPKSAKAVNAKPRNPTRASSKRKVVGR